MNWIWYKEYRDFWFPIMLGILGLTFLTVWGNKADNFFLLQLPHTNMLNVFFSGITWLGDGLFCLLVVLLLATFVSAGSAFTLLSGYLAGSALVQFLKLVIFDQVPRPVKWLELNKIIHEMPAGLEPHHWNSFPSGHSATAIALFFYLATRVQPGYSQTLLGLIAVIVCYSRIYLYMHFAEDVLAGLLIGAFTMIPVWIAWNKYLKKTSRPWLHKPLLRWKS